MSNYEYVEMEWVSEQRKNEYNRFFLLTQQNYFHDLFCCKGYISLEEMKKCLGMKTGLDDLLYVCVKDECDISKLELFNFDIYGEHITLRFYMRKFIS